MKTSLVGSVLAISLVALGACGGDTDSNRSGDGRDNRVDIAETDGRDTAESAKEYMESLASGSVPLMREALNLAAGGTLAEAYLTHQLGALVADQDAGYGDQNLDSSIESIDGGFEFCETPLLGDEACYEYTDFEFDEDRVSDFKINGQSLEDRLVVGDGTASAIGDIGSATLLSAYQTMSGFLVVVLEVRSGAEGLRLSDLYSSTYRSADGRQRSADVGSSIPSDLGPDSLVNVAVAFPDTGRGGTFDAVFYGDDYLTEHVLSVPVP